MRQRNQSQLQSIKQFPLIQTNEFKFNSVIELKWIWFAEISLMIAGLISEI